MFLFYTSPNIWQLCYDLALLSHSMRHSRTSILAWTIPLFSLSDEVLLPLYVGLMSFPISSMTARSWAYLLCGWPAWCCCMGEGRWAADVPGVCMLGWGVPPLEPGIIPAAGEAVDRLAGIGGGVSLMLASEAFLISASDRGVPGLLIWGVPRPELLVESAGAGDPSTSMTDDTETTRPF